MILIRRIVLFLFVVAFLGVTSAMAAPLNLILCNEPYGEGIWTMQPDGSGLKEISDFGWFAEFSRGGEKIAFSQYYKSGIWVMGADGSNKKRLTKSGVHPSWSPDGSQIVFSTGDSYAYNSRIWIMNSDGTNLIQLTKRVADRPDWAHFSNKIVFSSWGDGIWVINSDGTGEKQILSYGSMPSWSQDDQKIVFRGYQCIYTMNSDGSDVTKISTSWGSHPSMGPDGRVVFQTTGDRLMIVDNGVETLLTTGLLAPDWCIGEAGPPYELGKFFFSGVGLIPFTEINNGYATTEEGYYLYVENAPFGGRLHVFSNFDLARAYRIDEYKVQVAKWPDPLTEPSESDFEDLLDSWGNYIWDPVEGKFVYQVIAPDGDNKYRIPSASEHWYLDNLLIQWNTTRFGDGKYSLRIKAYTSGGSEIRVPEEINRLALVIDNTWPVARIDDILYQGEAVDACDIITLESDDELEFVITANDNAGHFYLYDLNAYWGENENFDIADERYASFVHGSSWTGIVEESFFHNNWPRTCAYNFRLRVWDGVINGYNRIHYSEYNKHITLMIATK